MITVKDLMDLCDEQGWAHGATVLLVDGVLAVPVFATAADHAFGSDETGARWRGLLLGAPEEDLDDAEPA